MIFYLWMNRNKMKIIIKLNKIKIKIQIDQIEINMIILKKIMILINKIHKINKVIQVKVL